MKIWSLIGVCAASLLAAFFYYAYLNKYIFIHYPRHKNNSTMTTSCTTTKRTMHCFFWHHDRWQSEKIELMTVSDKAQMVHYLIAKWLEILEQEQIIKKTVNVQDVALSHQNMTAYVSFDHSLFEKQQSIREKWHVLEGLLRTLSACDINLQNVQFLVGHQPWNDPHIDLSFAWPIGGFERELS